MIDNLILTKEEQMKGYIRPYRRNYKHIMCGQITSMNRAMAETYAREPKFYSGAFCCYCKEHFPLTKDGKPSFVWYPDGTLVGS